MKLAGESVGVPLGLAEQHFAVSPQLPVFLVDFFQPVPQLQLRFPFERQQSFRFGDLNLQKN